MALAYLPNLTSFSRAYGNKYDYENIIDALKLCNNLKKLTLRTSSIDDMSRIAEIGDLESLDLDYNNITKIEGLENKPSLTGLNLLSNQITRIEGLENLSNLKTLILRK